MGQGRALLEQGQLDAALAKLAEAPNDPDSLYYQGLVWSRKAAAAPAPTPPPIESPAPRGAPSPAAPEFKPEELQALGLFDKVLAARPAHPQTHLAIAEVLAGHAIRRHQLDEEAKKHPARRAHREAMPAPGEIDFSVDRVLAEYQKGQAGATEATAADALIRFAAAVNRMDVAQATYEGMIDRNKSDAQLRIRYADFLANVKKDPEAAIDQYQTAVVWHPEDQATKAKIADLYIALGSAHYARREYAMADARFHEAEKYVTDAVQAAKLKAAAAGLRQIRPER